jgi:hypothetical protein
MSQWYYARDDRQLGPVTLAMLQQFAATGQLRPDDLVWKDGMGDWAEARTVGGLFDATRAGPLTPAQGQAVLEAIPVDDDFVPPAPAAQPTPHSPQPATSSEIGYFNAASVLGARAGETLKGFPPPVGPQDEWPLSARHLEQFADAEKHRKAIRACSAFFNALCLLYVIIAVAFGVAAGLSLGPRSRGSLGMDEGTILGTCGLMIALAVLAFIAKGAVLRCRIWAPITFIVIFSIGLVFNVISLATSGFNSRNNVEPVVGFITMSIMTALFAWPCIRALTAIPRFRAAPLWAQESLVKAKL